MNKTASAATQPQLVKGASGGFEPVTSEQLENNVGVWKNRYGQDLKLMKIQVAEGDVAVGYFARLSSPALDIKRHSVYSRAMTAFRNGSSFDVGEIVFGETFLGGDARFKNLNSPVYLSAAMNLSGEVDFLSVTTESI